MNYEIVQLDEKTVARLLIRTNNNDPGMSKAIGDLWHAFFADGVYQSISDKRNSNTIGLYSNYESNAKGAYDVMACCEIVSEKEVPDGVVLQVIPAGKYAKFIVRGDAKQAVADFWHKLWNMELDRKCSSDFEEYQSTGNINDCEVHIYISLN
jgi:predicted transcriptional regulator YdeE